MRLLSFFALQAIGSSPPLHGFVIQKCRGHMAKPIWDFFFHTDVSMSSKFIRLLLSEIRIKCFGITKK